MNDTFDLDSSLYQKPDSDIKPVEYKPLSTDPKKRKEQIELIINAIDKYYIQVKKNGRYSSPLDSVKAEKLNYYVFSLSPSDRFDLIKELDAKGMLNPDTYFFSSYNIINYYRSDEDDKYKLKFPDKKVSKMFNESDFSELKRLLEKNNLINILSINFFGYVTSEEIINYFVSRTDKNSLEFVLELSKNCNKTKPEIFKLWLDNNFSIPEDGFTLKDFENQILNLQKLSFSLSNIIKKIEKPTSKSDLKEILTTFFDYYRKLNEKIAQEPNFSLGVDKQNLLLAFKDNVGEILQEILSDSDKYGFDDSDIKNIFNILGPTLVISSIEKFKEDPQYVVDICIDLYIEEELKNSKVPLSDSLNLSSRNFIKELFLKQRKDKLNINTSKLFKEIKEHPEILPAIEFYEYILTSAWGDKISLAIEYAESRKISGNEDPLEVFYNDIINSKFLNKKEKLAVAVALKPDNYILNWDRLGMSVLEVIDFLEEQKNYEAKDSNISALSNSIFYEKLLDSNDIPLWQKRRWARFLRGDNRFKDFEKLGYNIEEIFKIIGELDDPELKSKLEEELENKIKTPGYLKSLTQEQLRKVFLYSKRFVNVDSCIHIVLNYNLGINYKHYQREVVELLKQKGSIENLVLILNSNKSDLINMINMPFLEDFFESEKVKKASDDAIMKLLNIKDKVRFFDPERFTEISIKKLENIETVHSIICHLYPNIKELTQGEFCSKLISDSTEINPTLFDQAFFYISDEEKIQIINKGENFGYNILSYLLCNPDKFGNTHKAYAQYIDFLNLILAEAQNNGTYEDMAVYINSFGQGFKYFLSNPEKFQREMYEDYLALFSIMLYSDKKLVDYKNDLYERIDLYSLIPPKHEILKSLNFDQRILHSLSKIPSETLLVKSLKILSKNIKSLSELENNDNTQVQKEKFDNLENIYNDYGKNIPLNIYSQIYFESNADIEIIKKFNELYKNKLNKELEDSLFYLIINSFTAKNNYIKSKIHEYIFALDFKNKDQIARDLKSLRLLLVIDSLGELKGNDLKEFQLLFGEYSEDYEEKAKNYLIENYKKLLPDLEKDKIIQIINFYPDIEPFFTYAASGNADLNYLTEIMSFLNPGNTEGWKNWRYDTSNPLSADQLGGLSDSEIMLWTQDSVIFLENYYTDIGLYDEAVKNSRAQIISFINKLTQEHESLKISPLILNSINEIKNFDFSRFSLDEFYQMINKIQNSVLEMSQEVKYIQGYYNNVEKLFKFFDNLLDEKDSIALTDRYLEGLIKFLSTIGGNNEYFNGLFTFNPEIIEQITQNFEKAKKESTIIGYGGISISTLDRVLPVNIQNNILEAFKQVRKNFQLTKTNLEKRGIQTDAPNIKNISRDLSFINDICNILSISTSEIKQGKFNRPTSSKELQTVISDIVTRFGLSEEEILSYKTRISSELSKQDIIGTKMDIAIFITDNPYLLFNIGKYPLGSGSCQNYEGGHLNSALLGYVGDAHSKAVFALDLSKLGPELRAKLETEGIQSIINTPYEIEILEAIVARSIIKLAQVTETDDYNEERTFPGIYIEPNYTSVNKLQQSLLTAMVDAVVVSYARPMSIGVYSGFGDSAIKIPKSRNPHGQYEDGAAGNAGYGGMGIERDDYYLDDGGERFY